MEDSMPDKDTMRELSDLLGQLRWTLTGARAGGVLDWPRAPSLARESTEPRPETITRVRVKTPLTRDEGPGREKTTPASHIPDVRPAPCPPALQAPGDTSSGVPARDRPPGLPGETGIPKAPGTPRPGAEEIILPVPRPSGGAGIPGRPQEEEVALPVSRPSGTPPSFAEPEPKDLETALSDTRALLGNCDRCGLHAGRRNLVFGEGSAHSGLVFVGEGPGFDEDQQGRPFVGRAGRLLDKMILSIGLKRHEVYICNVVKCRPPENRTPVPEEIAACSPFLFRQLEALRPKVICALGLCAAQTLLGSARPMSGLRGRIHFWRGYPIICTYHPAYLLRSSHQKAASWQDLKEVRRLLESAPP